MFSGFLALAEGASCLATVLSATDSSIITECLSAWSFSLSLFISALDDFDNFGIDNVQPLNNGIVMHMKARMYSLNLQLVFS